MEAASVHTLPRRQAGIDDDGQVEDGMPTTLEAAWDDVCILFQRVLPRLRMVDRGCWEWPGARMGGGYGKITLRGQQTSVHRFVWRMSGRSLGGGVLDHLCRNSVCCNPDHLELVSQAENVRRGLLSDLKEMCGAGKHPWVPENIAEKGNGNRRCKVCHRERERSRRKVA